MAPLPAVTSITLAVEKPRQRPSPHLRLGGHGPGARRSGASAAPWGRSPACPLLRWQNQAAVLSRKHRDDDNNSSCLAVGSWAGSLLIKEERYAGTVDREGAGRTVLKTQRWNPRPQHGTLAGQQRLPSVGGREVGTPGYLHATPLSQTAASSPPWGTTVKTVSQMPLPTSRGARPLLFIRPCNTSPPPSSFISAPMHPSPSALPAADLSLTPAFLAVTVPSHGTGLLPAPFPRALGC